MAQNITLADLGWNKRFAAEFKPYAKLGWKPARLLRDNKISYGALLVDKDDFDELDVILEYYEAISQALMKMPPYRDGTSQSQAERETIGCLRMQNDNKHLNS